jgi:phosphocarrier protein HPr
MAVSRNVVVANQAGLHARAAIAVAKTVRQFASTKVEMVRDHLRVECKDVLQILAIGAHPGTQLRLEAEGPDAETALDALVRLFESKFGEE